MSSLRHSGTVDAIVIGAGLMGLSSAWALRCRGLSVLMLEAESIGRHASSASAGGVRSLNRHPDEIPLARAALPLWRSLSAELGQPCGFRASGQLRVALDEAGRAALADRVEQVQRLGYAHERLIDAHEIERRVPGLGSRCTAAIVVDDDGYADPLATVQAHAGALRRAGVVILEGMPVRAVESDGSGFRARVTAGSAGDPAGLAFRGRVVVNAAGAWGAGLAATAGDPVPLETAALQMTVLARQPPFVDPVVGCHGRPLSLKQMANGTVVIGGGFRGEVLDAGPGARVGRVRHDRAAQNLRNAVTVFPQLARARVVRQWAGLEGCTPDALPVLGPSSSLPGLVHAFGFSAHGFALAPLVGTVVADLVDGRPSNLPLDAFRVDRFKPSARDDA